MRLRTISVMRLKQHNVGLCFTQSIYNLLTATLRQSKTLGQLRQGSTLRVWSNATSIYYETTPAIEEGSTGRRELNIGKVGEPFSRFEIAVNLHIVHLSQRTNNSNQIRGADRVFELLL